MNLSEKKAWVEQLESDLENAELLVLTNPLGLTVSEVSVLRSNAKKEGASFKVLKNTLARLAFKGKPHEVLSKNLKGPTALAFSKDPIKAARLVVEFSKKNEKLSYVAGFLNGIFLSKDDIRTLSELPSINELRSKILGLISAPATKIARIVKEPSACIARVILEYSKKQD